MNRPLLKLAFADEMRGNEARKNHIVPKVRENSSTKLMMQFAAGVEFRMRSNEDH